MWVEIGGKSLHLRCLKEQGCEVVTELVTELVLLVNMRTRNKHSHVEEAYCGDVPYVILANEELHSLRSEKFHLIERTSCYHISAAAP